MKTLIGYPECDYKGSNLFRFLNMAEFLEEVESESTPATKRIPAGTTIYNCEEEDSPIPLMTTERDATVSCQGFGTIGITSDHWLAIQEDGETEVWGIFNEPIDETDMHPELGPKTIVLRTM